MFFFVGWKEKNEEKKNGNLHDVEATVVKRSISNKRPLHGNELHAVVHAIVQAKHYDEHDVRGHVGILDTGNGRHVLCDSVSNGDSSILRNIATNPTLMIDKRVEIVVGKAESLVRTVFRRTAIVYWNCRYRGQWADTAKLKSKYLLSSPKKRH